jgi:hypothetical protein
VCRCLYCNLNYIPSGISPGVVLLDHMSTLFFSFLRRLHTIFHSGCNNLYSHLQCMRSPFPPHPHQHLLLFVFLMITVLTGIRWNLNRVLICISFMTRDVEHFFMCLCFGHLGFFLWKNSVHEFISDLVILKCTIYLYLYYIFCSTGTELGVLLYHLNQAPSP